MATRTIPAAAPAPFGFRWAAVLAVVEVSEVVAEVSVAVEASEALAEEVSEAAVHREVGSLQLIVYN